MKLSFKKNTVSLFFVILSTYHLVPTLSSIQLTVNPVHTTSMSLPSVLWCVILQINRNFPRHGNLLTIQAITLQFPTRINYNKPLIMYKKGTLTNISLYK